MFETRGGRETGKKAYGRKKRKRKTKRYTYNHWEQKKRQRKAKTKQNELKQFNGGGIPSNLCPK